MDQHHVDKLFALTEAGFGILENDTSRVVAVFPYNVGDRDPLKTWLKDSEAPFMDDGDFLDTWLRDRRKYPRLDKWLEDSLCCKVYSNTHANPNDWVGVDRIAVNPKFVEFRFRGNAALLKSLLAGTHALYVGGIYRRFGEDVEAAFTVRPTKRWSFYAGICDPAAMYPGVVLRVVTDDVTIQVNHPAKAQSSPRPSHLKEIK